MTCRYVKLVNGDNVIADTDCSTADFLNYSFLTLNNPVQITSFRMPINGVVYETFSFVPWLGVSSATTVNIPINSVITVVDVREVLVKQYEEYINRAEARDNHSAKDKNELFEAMMQGMHESEEYENEVEEEDDDRIIH